jgi:hypothetical protein
MEPASILNKHDEQRLEVSAIDPFANIALAFSGGGFRAASFALGVLSYLNKLQFTAEDDPLNGKRLLDQVTYMSSASGGTITTALYALYSAKGESYESFYIKLFGGLDGEFLLQKALSILTHRKAWRNRPDKSRNIINAFSMAYDEYLFSGETLKALYYPAGNGHLQEVCFNTTEFYTGLSFRQDRKMAPDDAKDLYFKYGNENIYLTQSAAGDIKIADALAASSCFPAGFEPIVFPDDFANEVVSIQQLKEGLTLVPQTGDKAEKAFAAAKMVGFMDGGITDNQGLQSMMYADGRRIRNETTFKCFDLMMVSDVGSYFIKPYVNPPKPKAGGISLNGLYWLVAALFFAAVACVYFGFHCHKTYLAFIGGFFGVIPAILLLIVRWLNGQINGAAESSPLNLRKSFTEKIVRLLLKYLTLTPLPTLKQMLIARADSVLLLNMSVFLKRIRQLLYNKFYDSPEWKNRGKGNHIYDLAFASDIYRKQNPPPSPFLAPSRELQIVAQTAYETGTTLWFDEQSEKISHNKACIIACGEFTTCYNLLGYIEKLSGDPTAVDSRYANRLNELKKQLTADYTRFKTDPFFMYNEDGLACKIKDFQPLRMADIPDPGF